MSYLNWLNDPCSLHVAPGTTLPLNWTSLLSVQRSKLLPWSWELTSELQPTNTSPQCPTNSSKLLVFAVVNIVMLLLMLIISRRTVMKWLSCGLFVQESRRWYYSGLIGVGLHLASNAINAAAIRRTPGFEQTSIKDLTFF